MSINLLSSRRCFDGTVSFYSHASQACNCEMKFAVYIPPKPKNVPVLYWLSGLECNEQNFITKAGALKYAAQYQVMIVAPDTSPRGCNIPGEDDDWDFGSGAGFYLNATEEKWKRHYNMYDYIVEELPQLVRDNFSVKANSQGISGHSMGGHGALTIALKNPDKYQSVSAFAPICAPSQCPWGEKAFSGYLGSTKETWKQYDANELVKTVNDALPIFIDQGMEDTFLENQLKPEVFQKTCEEHNIPLTLRMQQGYDHSYYFVSTFIEDHIAYHANILHG